ncbi:MCH protein, partial [Turnix velox]|nr:MCH protein [Turnix velox]
MCTSSYLLILSLFFSQGFIVSVSKSLQRAEDEDMLLTTLNPGKTQNGGRIVKRGAIPFLKHYKSKDNGFLDEEDGTNMKFLDTGSRQELLNHVMQISFGRKQLPYLVLKGTTAFPSDNEIQNIESIQERETVDEENSSKFPIGRRDFEVLRCMLGRVYRPCWQV